MGYHSSQFPLRARRVEKQALRDADSRALRSGLVSAKDLAERNDFFASLDVEHFRLVAIGSRMLGSR
jgi:hypothetical protein